MLVHAFVFTMENSSAPVYKDPVYQPLATSISMRVMVLPVPVYVQSSAGQKGALSFRRDATTVASEAVISLLLPNSAVQCCADCGGGSAPQVPWQ